MAIVVLVVGLLVLMVGVILIGLPVVGAALVGLVLLRPNWMENMERQRAKRKESFPSNVTNN